MSTTDVANILVVDDLPEKRLALEAVLEELGQNVVTAASGREALRKLNEQDFAVILLDVNMPEMDGFETAALIRQRRHCGHTPIIFITAFGDDLHTHRGYSLGAVDYILSPVVPGILRTKVSVFVELFKKTEQAKRHTEERIAHAQEQARRAAAEDANRRAQFLAEASRVLANSLSIETTATGLARLIVPYLADVSMVIFEDESHKDRAVYLAWLEKDTQTTVQSVIAPEALPKALQASALGIRHNNKLEVISREELGDWLHDSSCVGHASSAHSGLPSLEGASAYVFPLLARGRRLGALCLARYPGKEFHPDDLTLAEDLAGRAAIALDNARLYLTMHQADQRKTEFLAMLAHELRNPLAPIRNSLQILRFKDVPETDRLWAMDVMDRHLNHVVRLVDDLLEVSRITRGIIKLQFETVEAAALVSQAVEMSRPMINERRHKLSVNVPSQAVYLNADPMRLVQVMTNLLTNAAKYTEDGGQISLTVETVGGSVVFRVRDTGIGIPTDLLPHVFEVFFQVNHTLDRSQGGLGIGLTLVHRLVGLHGGCVEALSAGPGHGSEFIVRLPALTRQSLHAPGGKPVAATEFA